MQNNCKKVGVIGFSFGALSALYNLFSIDYNFELQIENELERCGKQLKQLRLKEAQNSYQRVKAMLHESTKRAFGAVYGQTASGTGIIPTRSRGIPDAVVFAGMPVSLIKSKKMICPTIITLYYGWMRSLTNTFFNAPPKILERFVNGLERHNPIEEPVYTNKKSAYLKFFEVKTEEEFKGLKSYVKDITKDPSKLLPAFIKNDNEQQQYLNHILKRIKEIPKMFAYGKKDAIAGGSFVGELVSRVTGKSFSNESLMWLVKTIAKESVPKLYPNIGHTLDERAGFLKKLSRRPQDIDIQNDLVSFMNSAL